MSGADAVQAQGASVSDKWNRSIGGDFNKAADRDQPKPQERPAGGSDQVRNTRHSLAGGPPPPKGPGMAMARQQHREAMAADHRKATGQDHAAPAADSKPPQKGDLSQKGDLKRDFDRSR
jgi:hypothetical protein